MLYKTNRNSLYMPTLPSFLLYVLAVLSHDICTCFHGEVLAVVYTERLLTELDMTQCPTSQNILRERKRKESGGTMVQSTDHTREISVLIRCILQLQHMHTHVRVQQYISQRREIHQGFFSV